MDIFDQFYEINAQLANDEMWISMLENAYDEIGATDAEDLVERAIKEENEGIIYDLVDEGEYLLSLKDQIIDEYYDDEAYEEY
jgi:glutathionyl-hydroquinone reductase